MSAPKSEDTFGIGMHLHVCKMLLNKCLRFGGDLLWVIHTVNAEPPVILDLRLFEFPTNHSVNLGDHGTSAGLAAREDVMHRGQLGQRQRGLYQLTRPLC